MLAFQTSYPRPIFLAMLLVPEGRAPFPYWRLPRTRWNIYYYICCLLITAVVHQVRARKLSLGCSLTFCCQRSKYRSEWYQTLHSALLTHHTTTRSNRLPGDGTDTKARAPSLEGYGVDIHIDKMEKQMAAVHVFILLDRGECPLRMRKPYWADAKVVSRKQFYVQPHSLQ